MLDAIALRFPDRTQLPSDDFLAYSNTSVYKVSSQTTYYTVIAIRIYVCTYITSAVLYVY